MCSEEEEEGMEWNKLGSAAYGGRTHTHTRTRLLTLHSTRCVCVCGPPFLLVGVDRAQAMQKDEMTAAHEALPSFLLAFEGGSLSTPGKKVAHAATWMHNDAMWREGSAAHVRGELK